MQTYFEVLDEHDSCTPLQQRKLGTEHYGYKTLYAALQARKRAAFRYSDRCWNVYERHSSGGNDWRGQTMFVQSLSVDDELELLAN